VTEEVTKLALECLKIDLERLRMKEERLRVREEANKLMMEALKDLSPVISRFIEALVKSEIDLSSETFEEMTKRVSKLPTLSDFIEFAKTISMVDLKSLIDDLQKMLDNRGKVE